MYYHIVAKKNVSNHGARSQTKWKKHLNCEFVLGWPWGDSGLEEPFPDSQMVSDLDTWEMLPPFTFGEVKMLNIARGAGLANLKSWKYFCF